MPRTRAHFDLGIPLSDGEFEALAWGHIPDAMEDHWFMYFDGEAFCFHRSWTGFYINSFECALSIIKCVQCPSGYSPRDAEASRASAFVAMACSGIP